MRRRPIMKQKLEIPHKEETPLFKLDEELERPTTPVPIEKNFLLQSKNLKRKPAVQI
jgi:hypothetical protein